MSRAAPPWTFSLSSAGRRRSTLSKRLSDIARAARANGLAVKVESVTVALTPSVGTVPPEVRVRKFLKYAGRRCGLRASWPTPEER